jgi:uncharacterized membrane protein/plastocyanin
MEQFLGEWAGLLLRWLHVVSAIAWIGHAFLFHSIERALRRPDPARGPEGGVEGELWMVHGGGFFHLQKTRTLPPGLAGQLKWFKWEAALTWLSGFLLLVVVFYLGGGIYLIDPAVAGLSHRSAVLIGLGTLLGGWLVYDLLWGCPLGKHPPSAAALTVAFLAGTAVALTHLLSGRAAFLHLGALLGTIMAANVWVRILPGMRRMIAALESGRRPDPREGLVGKQRSMHNGYMHFPVIFLMISNHYPETYGHPHSWLVLLLLLGLGVGMRQLVYDGLRTPPAVALGVAAALGALVYLTAPGGEPAEPAAAAGAAATGRRPIDPGSTAALGGRVRFTGAVPPVRELALRGGCEAAEPGPHRDQSLLVTGGGVANAFVWLRRGHEGWQPPPAPDREVVIDQRACTYRPRVVGARVGQTVTFVNSDPLYHNVRTVAEQNSSFNLSMPAREQRIQRSFRRPEVMVVTRCDIHPWMRAYIGVLDHPWFAVSGPDGRFSIPAVPPGTYLVEAWHEVLGTTSATVAVAPGQPVELELGFADPAGR